MPRQRKRRGKGKKDDAEAAAAAAAPAAEEGSAEWHKLRGNALFLANKFAEAVEEYSKAVELASENHVYYSNRSAARVALMDKESLEAALADADKCVELDSSWAKGHFRRGVALKHLGRFHDSLAAFEHAQSLDDSNPDVAVALTELRAMKLTDGLVETTDESAMEKDKFTDLEQWLLDSGAQFPLLYMKRYSENNRGVHCRVAVPEENCILKVPRKCLITVEMGKDTEIGRKMIEADVDVTAIKHCFLSVFVLLDRKNPDSFYQPYYRILPESYPNMPIFWSDEELTWLAGSYMQTQILERVENIEKDYELICEVAPEFAEVATVEEFKWARMMVASRNFAITIVEKKKTDALVPFADMLNHYRPRETRWTFDRDMDMFTIHSLRPLRQGQQVYDSYGKKCNSRFLLNYGFAVENNRDPDGTCHNEVRLSFDLLAEDPHRSTKMTLLGPTSSKKGIRVSMHHDGPDQSKEAFSYLRFIHARGTELMYLPTFDDDTDLGKTPIGPISCDNEIAALQHLAALCREQLDRYPTTLEEDTEVLASGKYEFGSNRRNCVVVLRGEKEVCHFLIQLAEEAVPLLQMEWGECKKTMNKKYKEGRPETRARDDYMLRVVSTLVKGRGSKK